MKKTLVILAKVFGGIIIAMALWFSGIVTAEFYYQDTIEAYEATIYNNQLAYDIVVQENKDLKEQMNNQTAYQNYLDSTYEYCEKIKNLYGIN